MVQHEASLNHRLHYVALVRPFQLIVLPSRPNINIAIKSEIQVKKNQLLSHWYNTSIINQFIYLPSLLYVDGGRVLKYGGEERFFRE